MSKHALTIRLAINADKAPVLAFCATTWPESGYIATVWEEWYHDPRSTLLVDVLEGGPVRIAHVIVGEAEGWFEALRVAPDHRGQGFGWQMVQAGLVETRRRGGDGLRLGTQSANGAMADLLPQLGFQLRFEAVWFGASPAAVALLEPMSQAAGQLAREAQTAPLLRDTGGLYANGWSVCAPTPARLAKHLVASSGADGNWRARLGHRMPDGASERHAVALACGDVAGLLEALRAHPTAHAHGEVRAFLPVKGKTARIALKAGYTAKRRRFAVYQHRF